MFHERVLTLIGVTCVATTVCWPVAAATSGTAASEEVLEEITVTAEKQAENLQKTAAEVTVISADTLITAGVTDLREAQMIVPAVRFQAEGNNTQVFVRGVGANLDTAYGLRSPEQRRGRSPS